MRKQTKLVAVLSAAALLAIGASMTSFAATPHWDMEDGEWIYLDKNGDKVADEWKKSNGQWYYLDEDGYMAKDRLIEYGNYKYYVDANGAKVTNAWVSLDNDDLLDDDEISTVWFWFDGKGKAAGCNTDEGAIKKLPYGDGKTDYFIFNNDGIMLSGWKKWSKNGENQKLYFLGDENEGWARTGWQYLDIEDEEIFENGDDGDPYESEEWFWFGNDGKAKTNGTKSIGGRTYAFDSNGVMQDLWVYDSATSATASIITNNDGMSTSNEAAYYEEGNGGRDKNWIFAYPKTDYDDYSEDAYWFYLDNNGAPFRAIDENAKLYAVGEAHRIDADNPADTDVDSCAAVGAKAIKNKTYLFNDKGVMLTGLYELTGVHKGTAQTPMDEGIYYFSEEDGSVQGQMITNKKVTIDVDGEEETYYFQKNGEAYCQTLISGSVYGADGKLVNGNGDGSTYQLVQLGFNLYKKGEFGKKDAEPIVTDKDWVLMNENGKIKQSGTVTDVNGDKVTVKNYKLVQE